MAETEHSQPSREGGESAPIDLSETYGVRKSIDASPQAPAPIVMLDGAAGEFLIPSASTSGQVGTTSPEVPLGRLDDDA